MDLTNIFRDGMNKLAALYVSKFQINPEEILQMFCTTSVPLEVMCNVYKVMVNERSIQKIEDLEQDMKVKLWNQAKATCPGADKKKTTDLCRCIWIINFILNQ